MEVFFEKESKLKKFLGKDGGICREERQIALFLYLIFLKKKRKETNGENGEYINKTVNQCLDLVDAQEVKIIDVYYEVSLMRDYWYFCKKNKKEEEFNSEREFNEKVLHFCLDFQIGYEKTKEVIDQLLIDNQKLLSQYLGQNIWQNTVRTAYSEVSHLIEKANTTDEEKQKMRIKAGLDIAKMMMNVTPDILVVYKLDNQLYAKALECKYRSKEGKYQDIAGVKNKMQLFIQECIMCFCFGRREYINDQENHIPKRPESPIWKEREDLWKMTCRKVYKGILLQKTEAGAIKNCGVKLIRFIDGEKKQNESNEICLKELLENMY